MIKRISALAAALCCFAVFCQSAAAEEGCEIRYGEPYYYGTTLTDAFTERSLTSYEDGRPITLVSVSGSENAVVQVVDINAQKIIHTFYLDYTGYCYYGCVTNDGVIYFNVGNKVVQYDPAVKQPALMGTAPTRISGFITGLTYDEETGLIYGSVTNTGNLFSINPSTREVTTVSTLSPECLMSNRPDVLGEYIYFGGTYAQSGGEGTHVYRVNKNTGERTALPNPNSEAITACGQCYAGGKYIFAQLALEKSGTNVYIWDTEQEKWSDVTFNYKTSGMTDIHDGKYW